MDLEARQFIMRVYGHEKQQSMGIARGEVELLQKLKTPNIVTIWIYNHRLSCFLTLRVTCVVDLFACLGIIELSYKTSNTGKF